jgi:ribosomal protein L40E
MIVCRECGNTAPSKDGFCASCGVLLEWSGEEVQTPEPPPPLAGPLAAAANVAAAATSGTAGPPATSGPTAPLTSAPIAPAATSAPIAPAATAGADAPAATAPPTVPPIPVAPPTGVQPGQEAARPAPIGVQPDREAVRPAPVPMTPADQFGGLFCSACGTRNADGRTYCRYCGEALDLTVPVATRQRWWQRLFKRKKRAKTAGERPRRFYKKDPQTRRSARRAKLSTSRYKFASKLNFPLAKITPVLALLSIVGIGLGPAHAWVSRQASNLFGTAKNHIQKPSFPPVAPVAATASSAAGGHAANQVIDGFSNTWWQSKGHPDGIGETITVRFAHPADLMKIGLSSGADKDHYRADSRPRTFDITIDGKPSGQISFDDKADFQVKGVNLKNVTSLTFVVTAAYPGQDKGHALAIRELQFFKRPLS